MDTDPGYDELPELYALGLRLRRSGLDAAAIAGRLGIEPAAVPSLLRLAEAKLARALSDRPSHGPDPSTAPPSDRPDPWPTPSARQEHDMATHDLERLARESIDAFNRDDWDHLRTMITDEYLYEETGTGQVVRSGDELIATLRAWKSSAPDCTGEVMRVLADDTTTAVEVVWAGTQTGPMDLGGGVDFPPSGLPFRFWATMWSRWEGGKAAEERHHMDVLGMLAQIGALPAPSSP